MIKSKLILLVCFVLFSSSVFAVCDDYGGGYWAISSSLSCSNEAINVDGLVNIEGGYETNVTSFSADATAAYDLRAYSSPNNFTLAIPNLVKNESFYSPDWNSKNNESFYISMNETQHAIQIFSNTSDFENYLVGFDLDDAETSGYNDGYDLVLGYWAREGYTGAVLLCYNSTASDFVVLENGTAADEGSETCGNRIGYDLNYLYGNFTVYWNYSNTTGSWEVLVVAQQAWEDINTWYYDTSTNKYTRFKASAVDLTGTVVIFNNMTLNLESNFTANEGVTFNLTNSTINMNQTTNGSVKILFDESSRININNCTFRSNNSELLWGLRVLTANYSIVNSNFTNNGLGSLDYDFNSYFDEDYGGLIYNNTFARLSSSKPANYRCFETVEKNNSGMNLSKNTFDCDVVLFNGVNLNLENNTFYEDLIIKEVNNSNFTNLNLNGTSFNLGSDYAAFYNTLENVINVRFTDNGTGSNTLSYSTGYGKISWVNKTNFTIGSTLTWDDIYIENNFIGVDITEYLTNLNTSAQITFYNLTGWSSLDPNILNYGTDCSDCTVVSWDNSLGTLVVNVNSFGNYSAEEGTLSARPSGSSSDSSSYVDVGELTQEEETELGYSGQLRFKINGDNHKIKVLKFDYINGTKSATLEVSSTTQIFTFKENEERYIDLDQDGLNDIRLSVGKIITYNSVEITVEKFMQPQKQVQTPSSINYKPAPAAPDYQPKVDNVNEEKVDVKVNNLNYWWLLGIIVLVLIVVLIISIYILKKRPTSSDNPQ